MKIGIADHISIFPCLFLNKKRGKGNLITLFLFSIMESENEKTKGRYIQHIVVFRLSCFHLAIEKTKMGITDHISIFRVFL